MVIGVELEVDLPRNPHPFHVLGTYYYIGFCFLPLLLLFAQNDQSVVRRAIQPAQVKPSFFHNQFKLLKAGLIPMVLGPPINTMGKGFYEEYSKPLFISYQGILCLLEGGAVFRILFSWSEQRVIMKSDYHSGGCVLLGITQTAH